MSTVTEHPAFIAKLEEILARFEAVTLEMNDVAAAGNSARIVKLAKEHSNLSKMVTPYLAYKKARTGMEEAQSILDDPAGDAELKELARMEIPELEAQAAQIMEGLIDHLIGGDDANVDSVILEVRAGTGGDEAALFARDLHEMYQRYAARQGFKFEVLDISANELGGFREAVSEIKGAGVFLHFGYEGGGHRVQRVPATETQGRIHTSAATVAVLPEVEETDVDINWEKDVLEHVSAAGGPGGQNVNKVATAIRLEHIPTGITVSMRDERSQHKNRAKARRLMASRVKAHYEELERAKRESTRKSMIGSGNRNERVRTYNFPQNRCTDHRLNENYSLEKVMNGDLETIITDLRKFDRAQRIASGA